MIRNLHKLPGLIAAVLILVLTLSGVVLSVVPALQSLAAPTAPEARISTAQLAAEVARNVPGLIDINRQPSGRVIAEYSTNTASGADIIDPQSGKVVAPYQPSAFLRWVTQLHGMLLMGPNGRVYTMALSLTMILLCFTGAWLLARRMGGWARVFGRARGTLMQRLHIEVGRFVIVALIFSSLTGVWIGLVNLQLVASGLQAMPQFPTKLAAGQPAPIQDLAALKNLSVRDLRSLTYPNGPGDAFTVVTNKGQGFVDPVTGQMLNFLPDGPMKRLYETVYMLHTGEGFWSLGLLLGLGSLGAPALTATGGLIWWRRRRNGVRLHHNHGVHSADTIILVGSEGNATWGFARSLHDALTARGYRCHTAAMNSLAPRYPHAQRMFIMTSSYGDGQAPESAKNFLTRLEQVKKAPDYPVALLGFGDRQFPHFSQFAHDVAEALDARRWHAMLPYEAIDRQSVQEFARWGRQVGDVLGHELTLHHRPAPIRTRTLELVGREDFGTEVQAPTAVLRFAVPDQRVGLWARLCGLGHLPRFEAGDLVGILPPGSSLPRFYSLASSARDGVLEICVRKHPGGECSGFLHGLEPGDRIQAFIKSNPGFRPARGRRPVILIAAGTGVGPLTGFIRRNRRGRAMHLYFGGRDPRSDFLYREDLQKWVAERRVTTVTTAFSRIREKAYVQDRIAEDAQHLRKMIQRGGQIMVCGGRDMAEGVMEALDFVVAPIGLNVSRLKAEGRYVEDVY